MDKITIPIIIPTIGRKSLLKTIESINKNTERYDCDIVVIDNSSDKESKDVIDSTEKIFNNVRIIRNKRKNKGLGMGRKIGLETIMKEDKYEICFFTEDECVVYKNSIDRIADFLFNKKNSKIPYIGAIGNNKIFLRMKNEELKKYFFLSYACDVLYGLRLSFLKENKINFDENLFYRSTCDLCFKIIENGGLTGMIYAPIAHKLNGTRHKSEKYFLCCQYIVEKHKNLAKLRGNKICIIDKTIFKTGRKFPINGTEIILNETGEQK